MGKGEVDLKLIAAFAVLLLAAAALLMFPSPQKGARELPITGARESSSLPLAQASLGEISPLSLSGAEITIYQPSYGSSIAHIRERRAFDLAAGKNSLLISEISERIAAPSVLLYDLTDSSTALLEQTYTPSLSETDISESYIGKEVSARQGNSTVSGKLVALSPIVLETEEGFVILRSFDALTVPKLLGKPIKAALSLLVDAKSGGKHDFLLSYISSGISWSADYSVFVDEESADLLGLATVENNAGTDYKGAGITLVAGDIQREQPSYLKYAAMTEAAGAPSGAPDITASNLFEFKAYPLPSPLDIANGESKQVPFISRTGVKSKKTYIYEGGTKVRTELLIRNEKSDGLGSPLPSGKVRMFADDGAGRQVFIGETSISNVAEKENITLKMGSAFDLAGERRQTDYKAGDCSDISAYAISLRNSKDIPVVVEVREYVGGDYEILEENFPHEQLSQSYLVWKIPVRAAGSETLTYKIRQNYPYREGC